MVLFARPTKSSACCTKADKSLSVNLVSLLGVEVAFLRECHNFEEYFNPVFLFSFLLFHYSFIFPFRKNGFCGRGINSYGIDSCLIILLQEMPHKFVERFNFSHIWVDRVLDKLTLSNLSLE